MLISINCRKCRWVSPKPECLGPSCSTELQISIGRLTALGSRRDPAALLHSLNAIPRRPTLAIVSFAAAVATVLLAADLLQAGDSSSLIDISADGALLATANHDNGTVSVVDLAEGKVLREIRVGYKPEGVSFIGEKHE